MSLKYKRIIAALIDTFIVVFFEILLNIIMVAIYEKRIQGDPVEGLKIILNIIMILPLPVMIIYYICADYYLKGTTLGKKIVGIRIRQNGAVPNLEFALKHSCVKVLLTIMGPIMTILYLNIGKMPYDQWLEINIINIRET